MLQGLQKLRKEAPVEGLPDQDEWFATEAACEEYLAHRFETGGQGCQRCGQMGGYWISARHCWECSHCGAQIGLRFGTVMARSPLPLAKWFRAIRLLLLDPSISTTELGERIDIPRPATVRSVAKRIRSAMAADDAAEQLAGLDCESRAPPRLLELDSTLGFALAWSGSFTRAHRNTDGMQWSAR